MSKLPQVSSSKGAIPKQKGKSAAGPGAKGKKGKKDPTKQDVAEWQLPAFSVPPQKQKQEINWEKLKKDIARRQAPEGEDIKEIRKILREVKDIDVPLHEFINMVCPYTSDNGMAMRSVMGEDLEAFRKLARRVYETMTQDVSDVLVNEQLQMVQYYEEKHNQMSDKMMRSINEIFEMAPEFDFEKYLKDKAEYLQRLFPLPRDSEMSDVECDMARRQQAYHRLQWLKSEGERMAEENKRLIRRLDELKREQQLEQERAAELAAEAENKRHQLAEEETEMKNKLEKLNESIEKSFIRDEAKMTREHNRTAREKSQEQAPVAKGRSTGAIRKTRSGTGAKKPARQQKRPDWSSTTAADMEVEALKGVVAAETSTRPVKKPKARTRSPHFSPIKTPPQKAAAQQQVSPFHYSPPQESGPPTSTQMEEEANFARFGTARKAAAPRQTSPFHYSPPKSPAQPQMQETRFEEATTTVQQRRPQPRVRQGQAPRDTWGGYY